MKKKATALFLAGALCTGGIGLGTGLNASAEEEQPKIARSARAP